MTYTDISHKYDNLNVLLNVMVVQSPCCVNQLQRGSSSVVGITGLGTVVVLGCTSCGRSATALTIVMHVCVCNMQVYVGTCVQVHSDVIVDVHKFKERQSLYPRPMPCVEPMRALSLEDSSHQLGGIIN